jgi:hypothetical protein
MGVIQAAAASKLAEVAPAARERNLSLIVSTMPGLAWLARSEGYVELLNHSYLGLSLDQVRESGWSFPVHPHGLDGCIWAEVNEGPRSSLSFSILAAHGAMGAGTAASLPSRSLENNSR